MAFRAPRRRSDFNIAIICALDSEYNAICLIFDEFWDENGDRYGRAMGDYNHYTTGRIGSYNVVLALLPEMGQLNAATTAANFRCSYGQLELVLLVGVCGGVPQPRDRDEILLADVVIGEYVVKYDYGRQYPDRFVRKDDADGNFSRPNKNIRNLLASFRTDRGLTMLQATTAKFLLKLQKKERAQNQRRHKQKYKYPGTAADHLYLPNYVHKHDLTTHECNVCSNGEYVACDAARHASCDDLGCKSEFILPRKALQDRQELEKQSTEVAQAPMIHLGAIASADTVMKCGQERDHIAESENVIAFDMEGAGIWEEVPSIVIKGVCDYADSHKNKKWQNFAAATAAAAAKALLARYTRTDKLQREEESRQYERGYGDLEEDGGSGAHKLQQEEESRQYEWGYGDLEEDGSSGTHKLQQEEESRQYGGVYGDLEGDGGSGAHNLQQEEESRQYGGVYGDLEEDGGSGAHNLQQEEESRQYGRVYTRAHPLIEEMADAYTTPHYLSIQDTLINTRLELGWPSRSHDQMDYQGVGPSDEANKEEISYWTAPNVLQ